MTNPARELAELLDSWRGDGTTSVLQARMRAIGTKTVSGEFWNSIDHAVYLVRQLQAQLNDLEKGGRDVSHYHELVDVLHGRVYAPDHQWKQANTAGGAAITPGELNQLKVAADALEGLNPGLSAEQVQLVASRLQDAAGLAEELPAGPHRDRLLAQIELAVLFARDLDRFGDDAVRTSAGSVVKTLHDIAHDQDVEPEARKKALTIKEELMVAVLGGGAGNTLSVAALAGVELFMRAIGS